MNQIYKITWIFSDLKVKHSVFLAFAVSNREIAAKCGVSLSYEAIRKLVMEKGDLEREKIKQQIQGCLLYIKIDCATRHRVHYLGINVRLVLIFIKIIFSKPNLILINK